MTAKRKIEVFTAGCPACDDTIALVNRMACPSCEIEILDMNQNSDSRVQHWGRLQDGFLPDVEKALIRLVRQSVTFGQSLS